MTNPLFDNIQEAIDDPKGAFEKLFLDFEQQMRKHGVPETVIEGMQAGLTLAFRLGVQYGRRQVN
jgi:hypothetical protein